MRVWKNKQINKICKHIRPFSLSFTHTLTHPIFVIHHITQHVIQVQYASISMFQPVDLHPVAGVLEEKKRGSISSASSALFAQYRFGI